MVLKITGVGKDRYKQLTRMDSQETTCYMGQMVPKAWEKQ